MSLPRIGLYILAVTFGAILVLPPLREGEIERVQALMGGTVSIESRPAGIRAILRYGIGTGATVLDVVTPFTATDQPEGEYRVTYIAPEGCRPVIPMKRNLETGDRIVFMKQFPCAERPVARPTPSPQPQPQPNPPTPPPPDPNGIVRAGLPRRTERLVTLSLEAKTPEITASGEARFTLRLQNRSDRTLRDLPVIVRFDPERLSPLDLWGGKQSGNQVMWTVGSLEPQGTWERTFTMRVKNGTAVTGKTTIAATVSGRAIAGVPLRDRSARAEIAVLGSLPKTGAPLSLLELVYRLVGMGTVAGGIVVMRKKA